MVKIQERRITENVSNVLRLSRFDKVPSDLADNKIIPVIDVYPPGQWTVIKDHSIPGNDKTFTVPNDVNWILKAAWLGTKTAAAVGSRYWGYNVFDETGDQVMGGQATTAQGASDLTEMSTVLMPEVIGTGVASSYAVCGFPSGLRLYPGWSIQFLDTADISASDDMKVSLHFLEVPDTRRSNAI